MYTCPACNRATLTQRQRIVASRLRPVRCKQCGSQLAPRRSGLWASLAAIVEHLLLIAGAGLSLYSRSWWPLVAALISIPIIHIPVEGFASLQAITAKEVKTVQRRFLWGLGAYVLLIGVIWGGDP